MGRENDVKKGAEAVSRLRGTYRLTFGYDRDRVELLDRQRVDMVAPPGEPEPVPRRAAGFWVELRDQRGRRLYQRVVHQPLRFEVEIFPERRGDAITRRAVDHPRGTFSLLVPDLPDAETVVLFSSPLEPEKSGEAARELLSVELRGGRPGSRGGRR
jgi:hypothetical protein